MTDSVKIKDDLLVGFDGTGSLHVSGAAVVEGNLTVDGNTILGNSGSDALTVNAVADFKAAVDMESGLTLTGSAAITGSLALTGSANITQNLTVGGDLIVNGTTTTINTDNLLVEDRYIALANGTAGPNSNGGIVILSGASDADLVIGRIANDTWAVAKMDSEGGAMTGSLENGDLVNFRAAQLQISGTADYLALSGSDLHVHAAEDLLLCAGSNDQIKILEDGTEWLMFDMGAANAILPAADNQIDLGSSSQRFRNVFTGDLHLQNDRGHWTLIEEENFITFRDNKTGRRFKMVMEDITDSGTYGPGNDGKM